MSSLIFLFIEYKACSFTSKNQAVRVAQILHFVWEKQRRHYITFCRTRNEKFNLEPFRVSLANEQTY